jgi:hypothetical protein
MSCACSDASSSEPYFCPTDGVGTWEWLPVPTVGIPVATSVSEFAGGHLVVLGEPGNQVSVSDCATEADCANVGGARFNPEAGVWSPVTEVGAPVPRGKMGMSSNGESVAMWGGESAVDGPFLPEDGGIYTPTTDSWELIPDAGTGEYRLKPLVAWTGSKLLVWGGYYYPNITGDADHRASGLVYDSATAQWSRMDLTGAPDASWGSRIVWTGSELLVWPGGNQDEAGNIRSRQTFSAAYDPESDSWRTINMDGAPSPDAGLQGVWTGNEYVVVGGWGGRPERYLGDGVAYDPKSDTWRALTPEGAPHWALEGVVWTGKHVVAHGNSSACPVAAFYDPELDQWTKTTAPSLGWEKMGYTFWTGSALLLYEDQQHYRILPSGVLYATDP